MINNYKDLIVCQKAMEQAVEVYRVVKKLPREELYALSDQMRRAATSVPSNIAEGNSRSSKKEYAQLLSSARGSNAELQTQCFLCEKLAYLSKEDVSRTLSLSEEIEKMLTTLIKSLST